MFCTISLQVEKYY